MVVGFVEAAFAWHVGFRLMWLVGVLAVLGIPVPAPAGAGAVRRPLWVVAMSQAVAGIVVPAIFGLFFFAAIVGALLLRDHGVGAARRPPPHLEIPLPILVVVA